MVSLTDKEHSDNVNSFCIRKRLHYECSNQYCAGEGGGFNDTAETFDGGRTTALIRKPRETVWFVFLPGASMKQTACWPVTVPIPSQACLAVARSTNFISAWQRERDAGHSVSR